MRGHFASLPIAILKFWWFQLITFFYVLFWAIDIELQAIWRWKIRFLRMIFHTECIFKCYSNSMQFFGIFHWNAHDLIFSRLIGVYWLCHSAPIHNSILIYWHCSHSWVNHVHSTLRLILYFYYVFMFFSFQTKLIGISIGFFFLNFSLRGKKYALNLHKISTRFHFPDDDGFYIRSLLAFDLYIFGRRLKLAFSPNMVRTIHIRSGKHTKIEILFWHTIPCSFSSFFLHLQFRTCTFFL